MASSKSPSREEPSPEFPSPPRPFYLKSRYILLFLFAVLVYGYGWKQTEIDLGELVRDAHLVKPLIRDLLRPDLFTPNTGTQTVSADFQLTRQSVPDQQPQPLETEKPALLLSKTKGRVGDSLEIEGVRLAKDQKGTLYWVNSIEQEFPLEEVLTDSEGQFRLETHVPEMARGDKQRIKLEITWNTGGYRISETLKLAFDKIVETLFLALMATSMAVLLAVPLSFLGARNLMCGNPAGTAVYYGVRTVFNVLRSIEPLILAILFAVWVGIGPFAGVLALGFHSIAALGKLYSEQIENIDPGPLEAITATGAKPLQIVLYGVVPQIFPSFLAFTFYRWDINVRMSTIIGFVGGGGIGFLLQQWINLLQYRQAGTALLLIAVVVIALDTLSAKIREKVI